ncbi:MAG TPA: S8 family serine peptidase [Chloroflexota bacterium]|jgi:subtilisin family serine protease
MDIQPAYSEPFMPDALTMVPAVPGLDVVTAEWAWGGSTGAGVKVAVIDSGIDASHAAIGGSVAGYIGVNEDAEGAPIFDFEPHGDDYGHGTACAGIIRSLAPEAELHSIKVLGRRSGKGSAFGAGLQWAIDHGMQVCNMSLGTTKRDYYVMLHELADQAYFRNVMLVTAANNLPTPSFPSVYASVISVGAHAVQDPTLFYYNPSPPVEFGALGVGVRVAWRAGDWLTATGNSFAAPHITGLIARILSKHPGLTVFHVKMILRTLAANVGHGGASAAETR